MSDVLSAPLAPVVLFVFNRPQHTRRTLEALRSNTLAAQTDLFIYSDAARADAERPAVDEVRRVIRSVRGFRSLTVIEQPHNRGLAQSIIEGVSSVVARHGRVIVLEDDLETSPDFLGFMNQALDFYAGQPQVMHISGYCYPMDTTGLPDTFFLAPASCWGWATWARAWSHFERDSARLLREMRPADIRRFNLDGAYDYFSQVRANAEGRINSWAVFWYATVFRAGGLCLHPRLSLVNNIGVDGSGVHGDCSNVYEVAVHSGEPLQMNADVRLSPAATQALMRYFRRTHPRRWQRWLAGLRRRLGGLGQPAGRAP